MVQLCQVDSLSDFCGRYLSVESTEEAPSGNWYSKNLVTLIDKGMSKEELVACHGCVTALKGIASNEDEENKSLFSKNSSQDLLTENSVVDEDVVKYSKEDWEVCNYKVAWVKS